VRIVLALSMSLPALIACGSDGLSGSGGGGAGNGGGAGGSVVDGCLPGELEVTGEGCRPAGLPPSWMPPGPLTTPTPGVPEGACGDGFSSDGLAGCVAILPPSACVGASMAVPGDPTCRPIVGCGTGTWGDIPVAPTTVYVDVSFAGLPDGSATSPFPTLQQGVDAASAGAIVAVAAGTYSQDVTVQSKTLRLWGRCPEMVEVAGQGGVYALALIDSPGSEIHNLAVTGPEVGIVVSESPASLIDKVYVHDTGAPGIGVIGAGSEVVVSNSLVAATEVSGILAQGAAAAVVNCEVRDPSPLVYGLSRGVETYADGGPGSLRVEGSYVHGAAEFGVLVLASSLTMRRTLVADTTALTDFGWGLAAREDGGVPAVIDVAQSVLANNHGINLLVDGAQARLDAITVERGVPDAEGWAEGIVVQSGAMSDSPSEVDLTRSVVRDHRGLAIEVEGSTLSADELLVQRVVPNGVTGSGIEAHWFAVSTQPSDVSLSRSIVEQTVGGGVVLASAMAQVSDSIVRDVTVPEGVAFAAGVASVLDADTATIAAVTVTRCLVENVEGHGMYVGSSDLDVVQSISRGSRAVDGSPDSGIGIAASAESEVEPHLVIRDSHVVGSEDRGVLGVGASVDIEGLLVSDSQIVPGHLSRGIELQSSSGRIAWSEVRAVSSAGVVAADSTLSIDGLLVRDTLPSAAAREGVGLGAIAGAGSSDLIARGCRIEGSRAVGVFAEASALTLEHVAVVDVRADEDGSFGRGVLAQNDASLAVRFGLVQATREAGIHFIDSRGSVEDTEVANILPDESDGLFGDGIIVVGATTPVAIHRTRIQGVTRAAISAFGSHLTLADDDLSCNALALNAESIGGVASLLEDLGGNRCGCAEPVTCKAVSTGLAPPKELPP
jgi:hypothetical protein